MWHHTTPYLPRGMPFVIRVTLANTVSKCLLFSSSPLLFGIKQNIICLSQFLSSVFLSLYLQNLKTMPFCEVGKCRNGEGNSGIKIFYRTYGHGTTKVLLIIGLAGTHESWGPQIKGLTGVEVPSDVESTPSDQYFNDPDEGFGGDANGGIEVCSFDNRGMGRSSVPTKISEYTTTIMAKDAIALMDHLGWERAHVFGHSMGAMTACKLAAMVPDRILSLALLNVTGGGFECFPKLDRQMVSIAIRFLRAKTPEQRAAVDLETHYTKEYLDEYIGPNTRRTILYQEYVKVISSTGMQSNYGFEGQVNSCWTHKMTPKELEVIQSAGFLIAVIHGRHDIIAQIYHANRLAEKLQPMARMIDLHGGHLVSHERPEEVNQALLELIKASESKLSPYEWSNFPKKGTEWQEKENELSLYRRNAEGGNCLFFMFGMQEKLLLCLLYFFGLFVMAIENGRKAFRSLKPVRVGAIAS